MKTFVCILLIFSITIFSSVNAETLVSGKIYLNNLTTPAIDASVTILCSHNSINSSKNAISLNDGTYGAVFDSSECDSSDSVIVISTKTGVRGSQTEIVFPSFINLAMAIVNVVMSPEPIEPIVLSTEKAVCDYSPKCGNGRCESNENIQNCPEDCSSIQLTFGFNKDKF